MIEIDRCLFKNDCYARMYRSTMIGYGHRVVFEQNEDGSILVIVYAKHEQR